MERPFLLGRHRTVEPEHALHGRRHGTHRPRPALSVAQYNQRTLGVAVDAGEQLDASASPGARGVRSLRLLFARGVPPSGRPHLLGGQFQGSRATSAHDARNGKKHVRLAVERLDGEIRCVERERHYGALCAAALDVTTAQQRVSRRLPLGRGTRDGAFRRGAPEECGDGHGRPGAQVEHASTSGVAVYGVSSARRVDIRPVFIRQIRPEDSEDLEVGRRRRAGVVAGVFGRGEPHFPGVRGGVFVRETRHETIGQQLHGITAHEVAHEEPLAHEDRIEERPVVVGQVEFLKTTVNAGDMHRHAAHAQAALIAGNPERRVDGGDEHVGRWRRFHLRLLATLQGGEREDPRDDA